MRPVLTPYDSHNLFILHNSADGQGVTIDGTSLDAETWTPIPNSAFVYLEYEAAADATYDIQSTSGGFLAYVTGLESSTVYRGHFFSVESGGEPPAPTTPPPPTNISTPLHKIVLTGEFVSQGGENFTVECAESYQ